MSQDALLGSDEVLAWLEGRGLTFDTIDTAGLGYVPRGVKSSFWHCVVIPYFDGRGELRGVRYRHLRDDPPMKYQTPKGGGVHLYNVKATDSPVVAICEGEFDALVMQQAGVPAVALPGMNTWQREWRWLFRNCDLVYVAIDVDAAGTKARDSGDKARNKILGQVGQVTEVADLGLPDGMDVTDLFLKDPQRLKELLT